MVRTHIPTTHNKLSIDDSIQKGLQQFIRRGNDGYAGIKFEKTHHEKMSKNPKFSNILDNKSIKSCHKASSRNLTKLQSQTKLKTFKYTNSRNDMLANAAKLKSKSPTQAKMKSFRRESISIMNKQSGFKLNILPLKRRSSLMSQTIKSKSGLFYSP